MYDVCLTITIEVLYIILHINHQTVYILLLLSLYYDYRRLPGLDGIITDILNNYHAYNIVVLINV